MAWWGDLLDGVGTFVKDNESLIKLGVGGYGIYDQQRQQKKAIERQREAEEAMLAFQEEQNLYMAELAARRGQGGGGSGGGGGPKISSEGLQEYRKYNDMAAELYQPFAEEGRKLLPGMSQAYLQALSATGSQLQNYLTPEAQAIMSQGQPAYTLPLIPQKQRGK